MAPVRAQRRNQANNDNSPILRNINLNLNDRPNSSRNQNNNNNQNGNNGNAQQPPNVLVQVNRGRPSTSNSQNNGNGNVGDNDNSAAANNGQVSPPGAIETAGTPDTCRFSTDASSETKVFSWEIKSFKTLNQIAEASENMQIHFDAGASIGLPSKWKLFILRFNDDIAIFLRLMEHKGPETKVLARYDTYIKKKDGEILRQLSTDVADLKAVEDWGWRKLTSMAQLSSEGIITGDNDPLTIHIKFVLYGKQIVNISESHSNMVSQLTSSCSMEVNSDLATLLESANGSDVTFQVRTGEMLKAHKTILIARSPVFYAMFESQMKEQTTGVIVCEDLSAKALTILLKYIYTGSIDADWGLVAEELVYSADKYNLFLLKQYMDNTLTTTCNADNALKLLKLAKLHALTTATQRISDYIKNNVDGVLEKYE